MRLKEYLKVLKVTNFDKPTIFATSFEVESIDDIIGIAIPVEEIVLHLWDKAEVKKYFYDEDTKSNIVDIELSIDNPLFDKYMEALSEIVSKNYANTSNGIEEDEEDEGFLELVRDFYNLIESVFSDEDEDDEKLSNESLKATAMPNCGMSYELLKQLLESAYEDGKDFNTDLNDEAFLEWLFALNNKESSSKKKSVKYNQNSRFLKKDK